MVIGKFNTVSEAQQCIDSIAMHAKYTDLLNKYGSLRRVQQELSINPV